MLREFNEKDNDDIMKIWRDGNFKAHNFISNEYWSNKYSDVQNNLLKNSYTIIYEEDGKIKAFLSINDDKELWAIFVLEEIQREGIGRILINYVKEKYENLSVKVYEKNINATMFFKAMGFKKVKSQINEFTSENEYIMKWSKSNSEKVSFAYFDNSISDDILEKYVNDDILELSHINLYSEKESSIAKNIDLRKNIAIGQEKNKIIDHIAVIASINSALLNKNSIIYINYHNNYEVLTNVIKDYVNVKRTNIIVAIQKPFLIEGNKKAKMLENIEEQYSMYPIYKCNYDSKSIKLSFKEAFSKRDEEFMREIKLIAENMLQKK